MEQISLSQLLPAIGGIGSPLATIFILWKVGLIGNGKRGKEIVELKEELTSLKDNHFHSLSDKMDKIVEQSTEMLIHIKDIKDILKDK